MRHADVLFEPFERVGIIKRNRVNEDAIFLMPLSRLLDLLDSVTADTFVLNNEFRSSDHTYCASFGMGGGRDECWGLECRQESLNELARFAALYGDQVVVYNSLSDLAPSREQHIPRGDETEVRIGVSHDLQLLLAIRPLIEAGKVVLFTPALDFCPACQAEALFGSQAGHRLKRATKQLETQLSELPVEFYRDEFSYIAQWKTPGGLFRHEGHLKEFDVLPDTIIASPRTVKQIEAGKSVCLSADMKKKLGLFADEASNVLLSLHFQLSVANAVNALFLTNRDIDVNILSLISRDIQMDKNNKISAKHLTSVVPFAGDVPIASLLRLRKREEEAFINFRAALDIALRESVRQQGSFTERDARALYSDVIAPEIATLDRKVKEAKRDLVRVSLTSAAALTAMIGFGMYSGMVTPEFKAVVSGLGLAKLVYDITSKALEAADVDKPVRLEKFYFLWKVRNLGRSAYRHNSYLREET
jgi:hypothetical protein